MLRPEFKTVCNSQETKNSELQFKHCRISHHYTSSAVLHWCQDWGSFQ